MAYLTLLFPFSFFIEVFSVDCALDLYWVHTHSIASRCWRSKCMSMGFNPFLWRLNWSCHVCGHIQRTWLARSASGKAAFIGHISLIFFWIVSWANPTWMRKTLHVPKCQIGTHSSIPLLIWVLRCLCTPNFWSAKIYLLHREGFLVVYIF